MLKRLFIGLFSFLLTTALAFTWTPNQVPPGNHSYVLEIRNTGENQENQVTTIQIDIQETDGAYTVDSSYTFSQTNLSQDDLSESPTATQENIALSPMKSRRRSNIASQESLSKQSHCFFL